MKTQYHDRLTKKLNGPKAAAKTFWSILNTFVKASKIPLIPPLSIDSQIITDLLAKASLFNNFFRKQCSTIANNSSLPKNLTF